MKKPSLQPRKGNPTLRYEAIKFYAWPTGRLAIWGLMALVYAIFAGNRALPSVPAALVGAVLVAGVAYLFLEGRGRLILIPGFLIFRRDFSEQRWKWTEISGIRLDYGRSIGVFVSFQTQDAGRVFIAGPWSADEVTVHTALQLAWEKWGGGLPGRQSD